MYCWALVDRDKNFSHFKYSKWWLHTKVCLCCCLLLTLLCILLCCCCQTKTFTQSDSSHWLCSFWCWLGVFLCMIPSKRKYRKIKRAKYISVKQIEKFCWTNQNDVYYIDKWTSVCPALALFFVFVVVAWFGKAFLYSILFFLVHFFASFSFSVWKSVCLGMWINSLLALSQRTVK